MKILSVEDNEINQVLLTERLKLREYEVVQASDGNGAISIATSEPGIDLVLLDIGLPDICGLEVARRIRDCAHHKNTPIIFLTGHSTPEYRQKAKDIGIDDFYPKPVDFTSLFKRIGELSNVG